jgi:hypothetical protein
LQRCANPAGLKGFLFPVLPTIAGYCVRVRVKLGSSMVSKLWITRRQFPSRSMHKEGYGLTATGRLHARLAQPPAPPWMCVFVNVEPRGIEPLNFAMQRLRLRIVGSRGGQWRDVCLRLAYRRAWGCAGPYEATGRSTQDRAARSARTREELIPHPVKPHVASRDTTPGMHMSITRKGALGVRR